MARKSAGILLYKRTADGLVVLLVHPGGPFWQKRDLGAWSIPKGEYDGEGADAAARREFAEETGIPPPDEMLPLGEISQKGGKRVIAFAAEGDLDVSRLRSNRFEMEWPPRSGRMRSFPEVDRAEWLALPVARQKIVAGQRPFLDRLEALCPEEKRDR